MNKLCELRRKAADILTAAGNDSPKADIDYLLLRKFGFSKSDIILGEKELSTEDAELFSDMVKRLADGEPVQYIAGVCEFMSLDFFVNPSTLIPRADTEILVETVIKLVDGRHNINILEIGTGSGCIAVSLAKYLPDSEVYAIDISSGALDMAKLNSKRCGTNLRTHFLLHDIMNGVPDLPFMPDVVVSNPPYIPSRDIPLLNKKVYGFEPKTALDGGEDGLDFYRKIISCTQLASDGILAFEVGCGQSRDIMALMQKKYTQVQCFCDLSGIERVVVGGA